MYKDYLEDFVINEILPEDSRTKEKICFRYQHPLYAKEIKNDETVCAYTYYTI